MTERWTDGKHASTLAVLAMSRHQRDKYSKRVCKELVATLPEELRAVGQAVLDNDASNPEAAAWLAWAAGLKAPVRWKNKRLPRPAKS